MITEQPLHNDPKIIPKMNVKKIIKTCIKIYIYTKILYYIEIP